MTRTRSTIPMLTLLLALLGAAAPAAAEETWQLRVSGISAQSTAGGGPESSLGGGLGLEYRATPRVGVELGGLTAEFDEETRFDFFGVVFSTESEIRMTPLLARLNLYLTPGRRAELYGGPVAGWVSMSDLTLRSRIDIPGEPTENFEERIPADDQFAWGGHLGMDLRLGGGRSYLTAGATWLDLPIELHFPFGTLDDSTIEGDSGDLDPLVFHFGYSHRF